MAKFAQFAVAAAEEALKDAQWKAETNEEQESTVSIRF